MFKFKKKNKKKFKLPSALTILFILIAIVILISWIPGTTGDWYLDINDPTTIQHGRPAGFFDLFLAPLKGFGNKLDIIVFILVLGGFLSIVIKSQALDAGIGRLILKIKGKEIWIIPILMTLFAIGGTTYGMGEETIALYPILIPIMLAAGFDVIASLMTILIGAGIGCIGSILNPFVIAVSFSSSDTTLYGIMSSSGILFRLISFVILTVSAIVFVMWYANKVKKQPTKSPLFSEQEMYFKNFGMLETLPEFTKKRKIILIIFSLAFALMILSLISWSSFGLTSMVVANEWMQKHAPYIASFFDSFGDFSLLAVASIFLLSSIIIGFIEWKGEEQYIKTFVSGSSEILSVCLVIATAAGIGWIMQQTGMQYKLIKTLEVPMKSLGIFGFIIVGYLFFLIISIIIPSTSGFVAAVMPILGPTAELIHPGLWSGTITAFSFANGLINLFSPTSFILMAALSISKVPINKYLQVAWPFLIGIFILSIVLLSLGTLLPIKNGGIWF